MRGASEGREVDAIHPTSEYRRGGPAVLGSGPT
jgi:hypothetical protein